ncbi:MAG: hypothetical protein JXR63_02590 [Spirochaetales bacterium]|nr:hypothetical protein [Spirochaetales bacterium]
MKKRIVIAMVMSLFVAGTLFSLTRNERLDAMLRKNVFVGLGDSVVLFGKLSYVGDEYIVLDKSPANTYSQLNVKGETIISLDDIVYITLYQM